MDSLDNSKKINSCCRTCLNNTSDRMYISIFALRDDSVSVAEMLSSCTSIVVHSNDKLPKKLCGSCYNCLISFYDFKKLAESVNTKLWNHFQECEIVVPDNESDVILTEMKAEITDLGIESYDGQESESYLENGDVNGSSEPGHYQDDDTTHFPGSITDEYEVMSDCHDENHTQKSNCKSSMKRKSYTCDVCSENFKFRYEFMRHLVTHGEGSNLTSNVMENDNECYKCDICSAMFKSVNSLSAHKRKHVQKDRILSCSVCKKIFKKVSHLKRHETCHEVNRPHKCSICGKSFTSETLLNEHVNEHNGIKTHECPLCSKSFSHLSTLNNHIKIHMYSEKNYLCPTCGKKFDSSSNLNQHVLRHTGLKMFACSLCPRKFISKGQHEEARVLKTNDAQTWKPGVRSSGELKCHETTHSGKRSYTCDQCGSAFTKQSALGRHKFRHTGIKPFHCGACSTNFISRADLKRHYRMHTGEKPYRCGKCERAFSQNSDLVRHQRTHCGDSQFRCTQCSKTFRLKSELHRHISEHYITVHMPAAASSVDNVPEIISNVRIELPCDNMNNNGGNVEN